MTVLTMTDAVGSQISIAAIRAAFRTALTAASARIGATAPNPPVGCCLLDAAGTILHTAAHHRAGTPHAEARALAEARDAGLLERARIAVVTLEPCNHHGRTPPCSEALRNSPIQEVWVGATDPHALATGGIARLREQPGGCAVHLAAAYPALTRESGACSALIAPFARHITQGRCWITVKQALTITGDMRPEPGCTTFTDQESLTLAHILRRGTDAIITGAGTILADTPRFSVRHVPDHPNRQPRILAICDRRRRVPRATIDSMTAAGFTVLISQDIAELPALLAAHDVTWAMVEAGPQLLAALAPTSLWDDWLTLRQRKDAPDHRAIRQRDALFHPAPMTLLPGAAPLLSAGAFAADPAQGVF